MYDFCMKKNIFLRHIVSAKGIEMDEENVRAIQERLTPKSITMVRNLHGLTSFYRRFVTDFSTLVTPLIEIVWLYGVLKSIVFNLDVKLLSYF